MTNLLSLTVTLAAYTDTAIGHLLRSMMILPVEFFDAPLAMYVVQHLHF